jgi:hypothetical protein
MELVSLTPCYEGCFGDKRLDRRAAVISNALLLSKVSSIRSATADEASQKAAYRFLDNEKVEEKILTDALKERSTHLCTGRDVLVLQDSSTIDLTAHKGRLQPHTGLGPIGNYEGGAMGFYLHAGLVLDAHLHTLLGFSTYHQWAREKDTGNKEARNYKHLPLEQKESYKWIRGCRESTEVLAAARTITFVEDREGDIYEQFATVPDGRIHLIIRSRDDRSVGKGEKLYATLQSAPVAGTFELPLEGDIRCHREKRVATIEVRYCAVEIHRPQNAPKSLPPMVKLYAVEAKEVSATTKPVLWRILTTHPVRDFSDALWILHCYKCRWHIEQFFRLMKKKGFQIEASELETGWAVRKLSVLLAGTVIRVMQMLLCYGEEEAQPIEEVYTPAETQCMEVLAQRLQTPKVKNPYSKTSLSWATWIMARLGGWKGTRKERPPGLICLKNGVDKFNLIYQGWTLAKNSTPT